MIPGLSKQDGKYIDTNEEEEVVWSGANEDEKEVSSGSSKKNCDEICTNEGAKEGIEYFEARVEEPKVGMTFDTLDEAYLYYSRYAKQNGFGVAKKSRKKDKNGVVRNVTFACSRGRKAKEVAEVADGRVFGTQQSVLNGYGSCTEQLMWPNMMSSNMQPNMGQGGTLPFSPTLCPTGIAYNQLLNFPTSQSNMPSLPSTQVWRAHSSIIGSESWRGQSSFLENEGQGWGGGQ